MGEVKEWSGVAGTVRSLRSAPRIAHILRVLARHGFLRALRGERAWPAPARAREALEELGIVFIKFGQVLAVRRDLLPDEYTAELARLQDRLPPIDAATVRRVMEAELGAAPEALFQSFAPEPLAAASIAQVHAATLPDDRAVAVKIRRPGLEEAIEQDVAALTSLAGLAEAIAPRLRALDLVGVVREFRANLLRELDLATEARTIVRFQEEAAALPALWIPAVVEDRSTGAILTTEFSHGERIDAFAREHPEQAQELAERAAALLVRQVFEVGLFHADPHPGNLFVLPDGRICLHDFGTVGELTPAMRDGLLHLLAATVDGDAAGATDAYIQLGLVGEDVERSALEAELGRLIGELREKPIAQISVAEAFQSLLRIGSRHRIRNPGVLLLLARAFFITEALIRQLDPHLNVFDVFQREMERIARLRYSPARLLSEGRKLALDLERLAREVPGEVQRILRQLATGNLGRVHAPELERVGRTGSRALGTLAATIGSAGLLVSGALLVSVGGWHRVLGDALMLVGGIALLVLAVITWWQARG